MSDVALINGDIAPSNFGDIMIVNDDDDIIQMAVNNILLVYGTNEFHPDMGNMAYNNRNRNSIKQLDQATRNFLSKGFTSVSLILECKSCSKINFKIQIFAYVTVLILQL